jgi:hypothetical protein
LLDPLLKDRRAINYGVSGYGVDQIYLRFLDAYHQFEDPIVLIGITDVDLDRSILSFRNAQKPVLAMENGKLVVRNTPIIDPDEYLRNHPVEIRSYLLRFILIRLRKFGFEASIDKLLGYDKRHELILRLNRRILEGFKEEAVASGIRLYFVLFYAAMRKEDWRETFLKSTLKELAVPYFDTKTYLLHLLEAEGGSVADYYSVSHGHPNSTANIAIARGLAAWLEEMQIESHHSSSRRVHHRHNRYRNRAAPADRRPGQPL